MPLTSNLPIPGFQWDVPSLLFMCDSRLPLFTRNQLISATVVLLRL